MGLFLDVAYKVLSDQNLPMSAKDITVQGLRKQWLVTKGRTPSQTMKSKLSTDILKKKNMSLFMRTEQGLFALREWENNETKEFVADRFQKTLLDEEIAVFPTSSLYKYITCPGFHTEPITNGRELLNECRPMSRKLAENDYTVIQLVSVFIVKYKSRYLTYKRTKRLPESRLHDSYSIGFGGHVTIQEARSIFNIFDPINSGILARELMEELRLDRYKAESTIYKGLLYDNSRDVSSQHLGIVYDVILDSPTYEIGERGFLMDPKLETINEIYDRIEDFENWSVMLIDFERGKTVVEGLDE